MAGCSGGQLGDMWGEGEHWVKGDAQDFRILVSWYGGGEVNDNFLGSVATLAGSGNEEVDGGLVGGDCHFVHLGQVSHGSKGVGEE